MTDASLRQDILQILASVAPDADLEHIREETYFRDQFEFDSLDFLRFVFAVGERLDVQIRESDYPRLSSLSGCMHYLETRRPA